ncbi:MAG TPA: tetratricopeptide repeat protein [Candidatus Cloacimonadota bacterium]|mgnify:CR=1 FL=1|nr:tetratricopeptide repeat protein [Candidatus Cloacimonadota bacterium]HQB41809.1 tetratricopeptide repeat protein [Candidatus Cloacimonadota bacterium]
MEKIYQEIEEIVKVEKYLLVKKPSYYREKFSNYLKQIENEPHNKWHLLLNLRLLVLCTNEEVDAIKQKCISLDKELQDKELTAEMLLTFANKLRTIYEFMEAQDYYEKALEAYKELGDKMSFYLTDYNYAVQLIMMEKHFDAYKKLITIIEDKIVKEDKLMQMSVYSWLSVIESFFKNYEKSIEYSLLTSEFAMEIRNMHAYAISQNSLGLDYNYIGKYDLALEALFSALRIGKDFSDNDLLANTTHNIGLIYKTINDLDKAEEYYLQSLEYRKKGTNLYNLSLTYSALADISLGKQDFDKAEEYLFKTFAIKKKYKFGKYIQLIYLEYASLQFAKNNYAAAEAIAMNVIKNSSEDDYRKLWQAYALLEKINVEKGDYTTALENAINKNKYQEDYQKQESQQKEISMKNTFDLERIKAEVKKKLELEKYEEALKVASKTKEKLILPLIQVKECLVKLQSSIKKDELCDKYEAQITKMFSATDRIEGILNNYDSNKNISFKTYLHDSEMVEFEKKK